MRLMAMENGMTVWALAVAPAADDWVGPGVPAAAAAVETQEAPACEAPAQSTQKTTSHVSQNISSDCE